MGLLSKAGAGRGYQPRCKGGAVRRQTDLSDLSDTETHTETHTDTDTDTHTHTHAHTTAITRPPPNPDTSIVHRILQSTRCPITRDINVCWRPQPYFVELSPPRTI